MQNLAGHKSATKAFTDELVRCGITPVKADPSGEVRASVKGVLGPYEFTRAWRYVRVKGLVPEKVANEIYEHPIGRTDVRVAGHCAAPPPEKYLRYMHKASGLEVLPEDQREEFAKMGETGLQLLKDMEGKRFVFGDPKEHPAFVDNYHVDTEVGLYFFVETLKKRGLIKS